MRLPRGRGARLILSDLFTLALVAGCCAFGQSEHLSIDAALHSSDKPYIQAHGEATILVKPDQAVIELGVTSQASTAAAAGAQNASASDALLARLRGALRGNDRVTTSAYSIQPAYRYPKPGASPSVVGYTATNLVTIVIDDLTRVGPVIDTATQAGANEIRSLQYRVKDEQPAQERALREAATRAKARADAMATGLGLHLVRIMAVEQGPSEEGIGFKKAAPPPPTSGPPTPVVVDDIEVTAEVLLRAEIGP